MTGPKFLTSQFMSPLSGTVRFEPMVRDYVEVQTRLPDAGRIPVNEDVIPEGYVEYEFGEASDFFFDIPEDPVEDMDADAYAEHWPNPVATNVRVEGEETGQAVGGRPPQDQRPGVRAYDEIDRQVQKGRIYHPEDPDFWIEVERVLSIRFRGPEGVIAKFNLKPIPFPRKPTG